MRIYVCENHPNAEKHIVSLDDITNYHQLLRQIRKILHYPKSSSVILYSQSGQKIIALNQLLHDDIIYCAQNQPFFNHVDEKFSVCLLGAGTVGKTSITLRFIKNAFHSEWSPTIEDSYKTACWVDNSTSLLEIIDTAGQEEFTTFRSQWMTKKEGYILVYNVIDIESVKIIYSYIELLEQVIRQGELVPPIILVGNKIDLYKNEIYNQQREETQRELANLIESCQVMISNINEEFEMKHAETLFKLNNTSLKIPSYRKIKVMFTSAFTGEGIIELFTTLVREIRLQKQFQKRLIEAGSIKGKSCVMS